MAHTALRHEFIPDLIDLDATVDRLAGGFTFTEGPIMSNRIFKDAKPRELPVKAPTKYKFLTNRFTFQVTRFHTCTVTLVRRVGRLGLMKAALPATLQSHPRLVVATQ
jgi:hypothetical protein